MKLDLSRFEPLAGSRPYRVVARHPGGGLLALQAESEAAGIWDDATGALVWTYEGATAITWTDDGAQLLLWVVASPDADVGMPGRFERRSWPADVLLSVCTFALPWTPWPLNIWVAHGAQLAAVRWLDEGLSGWEPIVLSEVGVTHLAGAGFALDSEVAVDSHPVLSPSGRFAVSGYQTLHVTAIDGQLVPRHHGRFEVGRVVVMDLRARAFSEILVDDAVPVKLHGTAARWGQLPVFLDETHFSVTLPTGATRVFGTRG